MNMKKILCLLTALMLALGGLALAEAGDADLQAQLDAANARIEALEAEVELYKPYYERQIVAEYGDGGIIWLEAAQEQFEAAASTYSQYGLNVDDYADQIKQEILHMLVRDAVLADKAEELGLTELDEAAQADLEQEASETFENYIESYKSYFAAQDATDEEAREQTIAQLEAYGLTQDTLVEQMKANYVDEQLYNTVTADVAVTDEEIRAAYDEMVANNETDFASDYTYNTTRNSGDVIAWNPEGYRAVKHVLIKFDDAQSEQYNGLQSTLDSLNSELEALDKPAEEADGTDDGEEAEAPRSREEIQSDIARIAAEIEALYSQLLPDAQKVIDEFEGGADFDSLIEKYGEDPGMRSEPTDAIGYAVSADSTTWDPAFTEGAMSIAEPGQISGAVYGKNGIHIIYYMNDITPGPVPFEELAEAAKANALTTKADDTYSAQVDAWIEEVSPVYHIDRF